MEVFQLEKVLEPLAKAIKCLESGHSNPSDVFLFYLGVLSSYRQLFDDNDAGLCLPDGVMASIMSSICARYFSLVLAAGQEVYVATFFLHPGFLNTTILRRNNLNPLKSGVIVLRPRMESASSDVDDLLETFPAFKAIALFLKQLFCLELEAGTILAAANYGSDEEGVDELVLAFRTQLISYARGEYPFLALPSVPIDFQPLKYWTNLLKDPGASLLAPLAVKLFSIVPNSMAEERTMSNITAINTKERSRQNVSTMVHMTRIRQHLIRTHQTNKPQFKPVLKFRDLSSTLLRQQQSIRSVASGDKLSENTEPLLEEPEPSEESNEDWEKESESESDELDEVSPETLGMDVGKAYGVDLRSPTLLDILSDSPVDSACVLGVAPKVAHKAQPVKASKSTKKDTKGVDMTSF
ncbi:hypothetical protein FRC09_014313 [Ceratobasidium sp. 395]|nr:hypothetical protein FRC09_014313 [Ceratobasidium sp. 395]